jgi:cation diffusion facilitator family transporter
MAAAWRTATPHRSMPTALPAHQAAIQDRAHAGARLVLRGMGLNALLAAVKVLAGIFGHSYALVADAVESFVDIGVSLLVWGGFQWAAQPPDRDHPYGHGKAEAVAGMLTALVVLGTGAGIGWHAVGEIRHPEFLPRGWTLLVLGTVVALKIGYSRRLQAVGRATASTALGAEALHHLSDALTSGAAFVGISIAVIGGPKYAAADGWAALVASAAILFNGGAIFRRALNEVMDIAVPADLDNDVRALALSVHGVASLDKSRVRKSGLSYLVDIQIRVDGALTVREGHDIAHAVKDALLDSALQVSDVSVHVEPV